MERKPFLIKQEMLDIVINNQIIDQPENLNNIFGSIARITNDNESECLIWGNGKKHGITTLLLAWTVMQLNQHNGLKGTQCIELAQWSKR